MVRFCAHCAHPLPSTARSHAKYCDGTCRVAALRERRRIARLAPVEPAPVDVPLTPSQGAPLTLPSALTSRPRWVRYSDAKVPLTTTGAPARSNDASTWCSRCCR